MTTSLADQVVIRPLRADEVQYAVEIWKEQGLEEGVHTLQLWHKTDPEGFIGAVDKDTGVCMCVSGEVLAARRKSEKSCSYNVTCGVLRQRCAI